MNWFYLNEICELKQEVASIAKLLAETTGCLESLSNTVVELTSATAEMAKIYGERIRALEGEKDEPV